MHTNRRFIFGCLLFLATLCVGSSPFLHASIVSNEERGETVDALFDAMDTSARTISAVPGVNSLRKEGEVKLEEAEKELQSYGKEKREVRLQIASLLKTRDEFKERYGVDPLDEEAIDKFLALDKNREG